MRLDCDSIRHDATDLSLSGLCWVPTDSIWTCRLQIVMGSQQIPHVEFYANEVWDSIRFRSQYVTTADLALPAVKGSGSRSTVRWGHARSYNSRPRACARARCQEVAREMPVTPAEVTHTLNTPGSPVTRKRVHSGQTPFRVTLTWVTDGVFRLDETLYRIAMELRLVCGGH